MSKKAYFSLAVICLAGLVAGALFVGLMLVALYGKLQKFFGH